MRGRTCYLLASKIKTRVRKIHKLIGADVSELFMKVDLLGDDIDPGKWHSLLRPGRFKFKMLLP
jgi:hypothetical protein